MPACRLAHEPLHVGERRAGAALESLGQTPPLLLLGQQQPSSRRFDGVRLVAQLRLQASTLRREADRGEHRRSRGGVVERGRLVHDGSHPPAGDRHRRRHSIRPAQRQRPAAVVDELVRTECEPDLELGVAEEVAQRIA